MAYAYAWPFWQSCETDKFVVLYSGKFGGAHDFESFLRGYAAACAQIPELILISIGNCSRLADFKAATEKLGVRESIRYSDFVGVERMPQSIGLADVAPCHCAEVSKDRWCPAS